MSNASDFIIENGVLKKYIGSDGDIVIPEGVSKIDDFAFLQSRSNIRSISIPEGVVAIGESLSQCPNLISVSIPSSLKTVDNLAFAMCSKLTDIHISEGVTKIGYRAFYFCKELRSVILPSTINTIFREAFCGCHQLVSVTIQGDIVIYDRVFSDCSELREVIFEGSVTNEGDMCIVPDAVIYAPKMEIGKFHASCRKNALHGFLKMNKTEVAVEQKVFDSYVKYCRSQRKRLYDIAISNNDLLEFMVSEKIISPDDVDSLIDLAMKSDCVSIVETISAYGQRIRTASNTVKKKQPTNKDSNSLSELKKIWSFVKKEDGTLMITNYKGTDTQISIPASIGKNSVTEIEEWAFSPEGYRISKEQRELRYNISAIHIPEGIKVIGDSCFYDCKNLNTVTIPKSVTSIGNSAFKNCINLTSVKIPNELTHIGVLVFMNCKNLTIYAPAGCYAETYAKENNISFVSE